jgi:UDP-N-acetylmuramoyl-tripeptide--D-alanyl-D-alanine ligase
VAAGLATLRWLRVAQREHYIAGSATRFARRWWLGRPPNPVFAAVAVAALAAAAWVPAIGIAAVAVAAAGPIGLGLRGRTSPLRWTSRVRRLAVTVGIIEAALLGAALFTDADLGLAGVVAPAVALLAAVWVDGALALMTPVERRLTEQYVRQAAETLQRVAPRVVAITGSFGKTSTKEHVRDLVAGTYEVVASPASFNNRLGLAKAVNDGVAPGVEVFVAEMGTFAKGEIADLCSWVPPTVSVLTAVGPVHLERFGTLEAIADAKSEIFASAETIVINFDNELVANVSARRASDARVIRCSTGGGEADVGARQTGAGIEVQVDGRLAGVAPADLFPMNVACATGAAVALGVPIADLGDRLAKLGSPAHRADVTTAGNGVVVIDDTYNSNPEGAAAALALLARTGDPSRRKVVVTPGMIELGPRQAEENSRFAGDASGLATHVVVVGHTNRSALIAGARHGHAEVVAVSDREAATRYVRTLVGDGDVVLYENDLPDHHP